jgi:hypothetical protein
MADLDYDAQQVDIERQLRMAEMLRKGNTPAQGRMVGRFYVAADPMQHLAGLVNEVVAGYKERGAMEKGKALSEKQNEEFSRILGSMPQSRSVTTSTTPDVGASAPAPGSVPGAWPMDAATARAQATAVQPIEKTQTVNPTRQDMLQWAGQLYKLPMARNLATKLMEDYTGQPKITPIGHIGTLNQDTGEATPFAPGVAIELAKLEQQHTDLQLRLADKSLDRELRDKLSQRLADTQKQIAIIKLPDDRLTNARIAALESEVRLKDAKAKGAGETSTKPMPRYIDDKFSGMLDTVDTIDRQIKSFKDEYANQGLLGDTKRKAASVLGSAGSKEMQEMDAWWRTAERQDELLERYKLFGATLTNNELTSWKNATIRPGLSADKVREFLTIRQDILKRKLNDELMRVKKDGKFETEGYEYLMNERGLLNKAPSAPGAPAAPALSPADLGGAKVSAPRKK